MTPDRRRTLLLSVAASTLFWLAVDASSHLDPYAEGFLAPIPGWKRLLLVAVVAGVLYTTARLIAVASTRPWVRRGLWPVALAMLLTGSRVMLDQVAIYYSPFDSERPYQSLRFDRPTLDGTVWWNVVGGDCGVSISRDMLIFETETRVRREMRHLSWDGYTTVIYGLLDVWPHGEWVDRGIVRDGVIYWEDEYSSPERIEREGDGLRVTWAPELDDVR